MAARGASHGNRSGRGRQQAQEEVEEEWQEARRPRRRRRPPPSRKVEVSKRQGAKEEGGQVGRGLTPLADAERLLREAHKYTDRIIVGLSGGKDSLVTLDLCVREFGADNVRAFFMYLVKGLRSVETIIRWCERRYGIEVVFLPHWQLANAYKYATYMPHRSKPSGWRDTKMVDIEAAARKKTDAEWLAYGHRMTDSIERVGMLKRIGGFDTVGRRVYPLYAWNEKSVMAYLRQRRIPLPPRLTVLKRSMTGVSFREDVLLAIRARYPDDYKKIVEKFPYVEAKIAKYEMSKNSWKQDTTIDKWKTSLRNR